MTFCCVGVTSPDQEGHFRTRLLPQLLEEPLVEDEGHATDLLHFGLCCGVPVFKVGCDGNGQLPSELLSSETFSHKHFSQHER